MQYIYTYKYIHASICVCVVCPFHSHIDPCFTANARSLERSTEESQQSYDEGHPVNVLKKACKGLHPNIVNTWTALYQKRPSQDAGRAGSYGAHSHTAAATAMSAVATPTSTAAAHSSTTSAVAAVATMPSGIPNRIWTEKLKNCPLPQQ